MAAAVSMGDFRGSTWSHKSGKRTRISRTTAGQAELITGRFKDAGVHQLPGGLADKLRRPGYLKHVVKAHLLQAGEHIVDIVQIVKLPVQGRCGQCDGISKVTELGKVV